MPSSLPYRGVGLQIGLQAAALTVPFFCKRNAMVQAAGKALFQGGIALFGWHVRWKK
jgi:hypothetical protein